MDRHKKRPTKAGSNSAQARKRRTSRTAGRGEAAATLRADLQLRLRELEEAREHQAATAEVLNVISNSMSDAQQVFNAIVQSGLRLFPDAAVSIALAENGMVKLAAMADKSQVRTESWRKVFPFPLSREYMHSLAILDRNIVDVPDVRDAPPEFAVGAKNFLASGYRGVTIMPMMRGDDAIGALSIVRLAAGSLSDKQIGVLKTFAAQAVIAIENTRVLNELRQRTDDLSEALERQTATSDVLQVISSSPGQLEPVFRSMLENATRICEAKFGTLNLYDGAQYRIAAYHKVPAVYAKTQRDLPFRPHPKSGLARVIATKRVVHIDDLREQPPYREGDSAAVAVSDLGGARTMVIVPMLKQRKFVGAIAVFRQEVRSFTDKQIELVQNFAAQAVIAIENTRLLSELRESLQQQTATADVLKVISRSTFDLQVVLDTLVQSVVRLCEADTTAIARQRDANYHVVSSHGFPPGFSQYMATVPMEAGRASLGGRVLLDSKPVQIPDVLSDPDYALTEAQKRGGYRTGLGVPLLREGSPIGILFLFRATVRPFTEKQIELATTFADQAVIAIENVRLFDEIQDKSRQLAEASQHKSQFLANMSHELRTPLNAILGYTELISDGVYGVPPEKMHAVLKRVESNGRHLLGLINAVLDLSKIEAGQLTLDLADYSLGDVTQTVYGAVEALAIDKKLAFKVDVAPDLPRGHGDERRLAQVLLNLVGNAIKFTDAGEVVVTAAANNGSFNVSVRDTGPGISTADQAKLFQEFQQADNSLTRKKGGTGLGLAISKRIIEMHGGRIWVESEIGRGSTFFVTLPVHAQTQPAALAS